MLNSVKRLTDSTLTATDGAIGHVNNAFFDDQAWTIRYLVINTGNWLAEREVLISPYSVKQPVGSVKNIDVSLTREQVKNSPDIDTRQPVSRQHEREYLGYYGYPEYWAGEGLWGMDAFPYFAPVPETAAKAQTSGEMRERELREGDVHLRSSGHVTGYDIHASDGSIGHVQDFVFDDESWTIRYLVVDTHNWWPGGKKVLVATHWIEGIDWATKRVNVDLTRLQIKSSPPYEEAEPISRDYEKRLHDAYNRKNYWD